MTYKGFGKNKRDTNSDVRFILVNATNLFTTKSQFVKLQPTEPTMRTCVYPATQFANPMIAHRTGNIDTRQETVSE